MFYFQASDAVRVDTASAVAVIEFLFGKGRAVCMTGDENDMFFSCKGLQPLFCCLFSRVVFCGAGGIQDSVMFQGLPEISDEKAGETPEGGSEQICLMAVSKIDIPCTGRSGIFQNDSRIKPDFRPERTIV